MSLQQQTRPAYPNKRNAMSPTAAGSSATYPQGGWTAGPSYYHNQNAAAAGAQRYAQPSNVQAYGSYRQPSVSALFELKDLHLFDTVFRDFTHISRCPRRSYIKIKALFHFCPF